MARRVFAFEPEGQNYATLYKNIAWNRCTETSTAHCIAIMDDLRIDYLNLAQFTIASAMHAFGKNVRQPAADGSTELERSNPTSAKGQYRSRSTTLSRVDCHSLALSRSMLMALSLWSSKGRGTF